jgi:hypothetical protein
MNPSTAMLLCNREEEEEEEDTCQKRLLGLNRHLKQPYTRPLVCQAKALIATVAVPLTWCCTSTASIMQRLQPQNRNTTDVKCKLESIPVALLSMVCTSPGLHGIPTNAHKQTRITNQPQFSSSGKHGKKTSSSLQRVSASRSSPSTVNKSCLAGQVQAIC